RPRRPRCDEPPTPTPRAPSADSPSWTRRLRPHVVGQLDDKSHEVREIPLSSECALRIARQAPLERGPQVVERGLEPLDVGPLPAVPDPGLEGLGQRQVVAEVAVAER